MEIDEKIKEIDDDRIIKKLNNLREMIIDVDDRVKKLEKAWASSKELSILEVATDLERIKRILIEKTPLQKEKPSKFAKMFPQKIQKISEQ